VADGCDYVGVGPVQATPTKPGREPVGLDYVRQAAAASPIPFFAIGGIDATNLEGPLAAGASRVAVVRAITEAADPGAASAELLGRMAQVERIQRMTNSRTDARTDSRDGTPRRADWAAAQWRGALLPRWPSLQAVLEHFGYRPQLVVVEFNGEILARRHWPDQPVRQADSLEVVTIVGGFSDFQIRPVSGFGPPPPDIASLRIPFLADALALALVLAPDL
jgi:thiamine biosynthesis protein ThiS